ncbi:hypothetical protein SAMN05216605_101351 [Pseudomonas abietaniphila]|uniref:Uncharacterized protein n=1 Tax=Pseudomonas abietaniphila TaxID=89065 RepID=A0A1G7S4V3_9PSED|nr:hypothetical protein SAMN05216605_101351 [Pseudomonas abietaniphila]
MLKPDQRPADNCAHSERTGWQAPIAGACRYLLIKQR